MSVDIVSGGIVEVDTESLRAAAGRWRMLATQAAQIGSALTSALVPVSGTGAQAALSAALDGIHAGRDGAERHAEDLATLALLYEIVEERAALEAARLTGGAGLIAQHEARLRVLESQAALAGLRASVVTAQAGVRQFAPLLREIDDVAQDAGLAANYVRAFGLLALWTLEIAGRGTVRNGSRLAPNDSAAEVQLLGEYRGSAPEGVADVIERIPAVADERVRVERYAMPDGSRQFVLYLAGTQAWWLPGTEPNDVLSDIQMYLGRNSAAYEAILAALDHAGVTGDDRLHVVGHSLGAMGASRLAATGDYRVETLLTAGSPIQAELPEDTLAVALRHSDDPVVALASGGLPAPTGADGSFTAQRDVGPGDVLDAHTLEEYQKTAAELDASVDPRMGAVREVFAGLGSATSVTTFLYGAERVTPPSPRGGGGRVVPH